MTEDLTAGLAALNGRDQEAALADLLQCCGSPRWAAAMAAARPFGSPEAVFQAAQAQFDELERADWLEAFAAHPRLGQKKSAAQSAAANAWSAQEQRSVQSAGDEVRETLAQLNEAYFERMGFIFILCASGRSAASMVEAIRARLDNTVEQEIAIAAGEQRKITRLRLERLLATLAAG